MMNRYNDNKYGYWIALAMIVVAAGFFALSYYGNDELGIVQQDIAFVIAGGLAVAIGISVGWAHKMGDIVPLILVTILVAAAGVAIYQGVLLPETPVEAVYAGAAAYVYGIIVGKRL